MVAPLFAIASLIRTVCAESGKKQQKKKKKRAARRERRGKRRDFERG